MFTIFWPIQLMLWLLKAFFSLLVFISCVLTIGSFMGDRGWLWSLSTHFHVQYLVIQLLALLGATISYGLKNKKEKVASKFTEKWLNLVVLMFFAGLNLWQIAPYYLPASKDQLHAATPHQTLKLMHINLWGYFNRKQQLVMDAIREQNPDMIDLVEYTEPWQHDLERAGLFKKYPYRVSGQEHIALYSKWPLKNARLIYADLHQKGSFQANIIAQFTLNHQPVTILVAHPAAPMLPSHLQWLQNSFRKWEEERSRLGRNLLIVGDLNTAPWSAEFVRLTQETGLRDSQLGYGLQPSWPTFLPFISIAKIKSIWAMPFGIPIDHVLVSKKIQVLSRYTGPFVGSDHLPVLIQLTVNE